MNNRWHR